MTEQRHLPIKLNNIEPRGGEHMYLISTPHLLSKERSQVILKEAGLLFPPGYVRFVEQFGEGTYRGWMNVYLPDVEVLKAFAEYDLWEHAADDPITQEQIAECVAIGTTVDGDFLAIHSGTNQLLWLPRHEERIKAIKLTSHGESKYITVLDEIYLQMYGSQQTGALYYEPWSTTRSHLFLRLPPTKSQLSLEQLAVMLTAQFPPDLVIEHEYSGQFFYRKFDGYIRFNYANKQEIALVYEGKKEREIDIVKQWLSSQGCEGY